MSTSKNKKGVSNQTLILVIVALGAIVLFSNMGSQHVAVPNNVQYANVISENPSLITGQAATVLGGQCACASGESKPPQTRTAVCEDGSWETVSCTFACSEGGCAPHLTHIGRSEVDGGASVPGGKDVNIFWVKTGMWKANCPVSPSCKPIQGWVA